MKYEMKKTDSYSHIIEQTSYLIFHFFNFIPHPSPFTLHPSPFILHMTISSTIARMLASAAVSAGRNAMHDSGPPS